MVSRFSENKGFKFMFFTLQLTFSLLTYWSIKGVVSSWVYWFASSSYYSSKAPTTIVLILNIENDAILKEHLVQSWNVDVGIIISNNQKFWRPLIWPLYWHVRPPPEIHQIGMVLKLPSKHILATQSSFAVRWKLV